MIGLGVGIDYALFIVTRYREQLHDGHDVRGVDRRSPSTPPAGPSLFAGITVVISLLGMLLMGVASCRASAVGAASIVLVTMRRVAHPAARAARLRRQPRRASPAGAASSPPASSPSRLVGVGPQDRRRSSLGLPLAVVVLVAGFFVRGRSSGEVPAPAAEAAARDRRPTGGAASIQHRPWPAASPAPWCSLVLAIPVLGLRLGFSDESNYAEDTTTKQAYDLLVDGFGPGFNGPLIARRRGARRRRPVADARRPITDARRAPTRRRLRARRRIPNDPTRPDRGAVDVDPHDRAAGRGDRRSSSTACARRAARRSSGRRPRRVVTGAVAVNVDFSDYLGRAHAVLLRRGAGAVVPAADGRVPVAARAAQGRDHEPAVDRRRLRRRRRPVPVGLAERPHRRRSRPRSSRGCR